MHVMGWLLSNKPRFLDVIVAIGRNCANGLKVVDCKTIMEMSAVIYGPPAVSRGVATQRVAAGDPGENAR
jgi:hypothetical protein